MAPKDKRLTKRGARNLVRAVGKAVAWDNVHSRYRYDVWGILAFLRGPDTGEDTLKEYTTARVRAFVSKTCPGSVRTLPLTVEERKTRNLLLAEATNHFTAHWNQAVYAIRFLFDYDLITESKWKAKK